MSHKTLSTIEARRAIVIDFEGIKRHGENRHPMPTLLGADGPWGQRRPHYKAYLLKEFLKPISKSRTLRVQPILRSLEDALHEVCELAESCEVRIVYYSVHEDSMIKMRAPEVYDRFKSLAINALPIARKACRAGGMRTPFTLERVITHLNRRRTKTPIPPVGVKGVADACRKIEAYARKNSRWRNWAPDQKRLVDELLRYNEEDCKATRKVLISCCHQLQSG